MTISYPPVNPSFPLPEHPISHLYLDSHTFSFYKEQASSYLSTNPGSNLSSFLNDLPLLPNQQFHQTPNRILKQYPANTSRAIKLTPQSVLAYMHVATDFLQSTSNPVIAVAHLLSNIAYGAIYPTLYPTTFSLAPSADKISISPEAAYNLQLKSEAFSPSMYEAISRYLNLLAAQDIVLLDTKPTTIHMEHGSMSIDVRGTPPTPNRSSEIFLKLPLDYLVKQAEIHGVRAYRGRTPLAKAGQVVEYIGLGWLTPEKEPIIV